MSLLPSCIVVPVYFIPAANRLSCVKSGLLEEMVLLVFNFYLYPRLEPLKYSKYSAYLDVIEELALRLSLQQKRRLKRKLRYPSTPSATTTPSNGSATDSALMEPTRLESSPAEDVLVKSPAKKKRKKNEPLTKKAKEKELMKQKKAKDKALKRAEKARLKAGGELSTGEDDDKTDQGLSSSGGSHLSAALSSSTSKKAKSSRSKKGGEKKKNDKKKKKDGSSSASKSPARESKTAKRKRSKKDGKEATSTTVQALPPFEHPWTVSEDRIILSCVKAFGENWLLISDLVNSSFYSFWSRRTSKQCYHRFKYHLRDGGEPGEVAAHAASPAAVAARKKAAAESLALAQGTLTTAEITIIEVMKKRAKDLARQHALQQSLAHAAFTSTSLPKPVVSEEPPGFKSPLRTLTDLKYKRLLHAQNSGDGHKGRSGSNNNVRRDGSAASSSEAAGDSNDTTSGQTGSRSTPMQTSSSTVGRGNSGVSLYAPGTASTAPSGDSDRGSARSMFHFYLILACHFLIPFPQLNNALSSLLQSFLETQVLVEHSNRSTKWWRRLRNLRIRIPSQLEWRIYTLVALLYCKIVIRHLRVGSLVLIFPATYC